MLKKRTLGCIKDTEDQRDYIFKASTPVQLPEKVDLRPLMSKVENQKTLGACVPHSIIGTLEYYKIKDKLPYEDLSRLFLYYNTRLLQNTVSDDSGCSIRTCLKALSKYGCCSELLWKYDCRRYKTKPYTDCYRDANRNKTVQYYRVYSIQDIKQAISEGHPVIFGADIFSSFETINIDGIVPIPKDSDYYLGGHCMLAVGYDELGFIVRNSWGTSWGEIGYCHIPYKFITTYCFDFWIVKSS